MSHLSDDALPSKINHAMGHRLAVGYELRKYDHPRNVHQIGAAIGINHTDIHKALAEMRLLKLVEREAIPYAEQTTKSGLWRYSLTPYCMSHMHVLVAGVGNKAR